MAVYEQGVAALQQKQYGEAAGLLRSLIESYPDEKELHDRARLYLNICGRHAAPPDDTPRTFEERVSAATVLMNAGRHDAALQVLEALVREDADNDHVHYLLAVVQALRGEADSAVAHLQRAVALNPENWHRARQDSDLDALKTDPALRAILDRAPSGRRDRRGGARVRSGH